MFRYFVTNNQLSGQISAVAAQLNALAAIQKTASAQLAALLKLGDKILSTLDDDVAAIAEQTTVVAGLATFVQGLKDQINALPGLSAAQQAKIDAIFAGAKANNKTIADAMVANTPADPGSPPTSLPGSPPADPPAQV